MNNENSTIVIDQQALATGCVHWKRTVPYSNVVKRTTQTICTGYKESIGVLESRYFFDYLCHWNWFLFSPLVFNLFLYIFFSNSRRWVSLTGNSLRAEKSHWRVQEVTLAGPKIHTRAKMSHCSVIMNVIKRFWALCLDTHMKLALYKHAIVINVIIIIIIKT